ncbi:hypothetical protein BIW11_06451 [Tropilaelaps mercedesae]|uniref:Uncharacterized protein n=1 Tax=Tropilaelaps mercedesae TaxID=418985 RepID=A0A1V9XY37_9ACAR|nr:hypothetical protein BIW11_06451 [Tropilaelaps mercedesae]
MCCVYKTTQHQMKRNVHEVREQKLKRVAKREKSDRIFKYVSKHIFGWSISAICTLGCGYQALTALQTYLEHPSVVSSTYVKEAAEFPGVTICPENWYNMTQVCKFWPRNCTRKDVMQAYSLPKLVTLSEFRFYGQPLLQSLFRCQMMSRTELCQPFDCVK